MLAWLLALAPLCGPARVQDSAEGEPRWRIGLTARIVEEVPDEELLATKQRLVLSGPPQFEVEEHGGVLAIRIYRGDGYSSDSVRLWLGSDGAHAAASSGSCVHFWIRPILGGTACLTTDGARSALDFEVYDGADAAYAQAYFGRVQLGARGVALAEALLAREVQVEPLRMESLVHTPGSFRETRCSIASRGLVDGFGRRQGLWIVRDGETDSVLLEMSWRDGRPDGIYRRSTSGASISAGTFRMGFEDGQHIVWHDDGDRRVMHFTMGLQDGDQTVYDAQGRRRMEWTRYSGRERRREWSPNGHLTKDEPIPDLGLGDIASQRRRHAVHLEWIGQLFTRRSE